MIDDFIRAYIDAIIFTECHSDNPDLENLTAADISPAMRERIQVECAAFYTANMPLWCSAYRISEYTPDEKAGHDFWLTRNHHGAGYWDRGMRGDASERLTKLAHACGSRDVYAANGKLEME